MEKARVAWRLGANSFGGQYENRLFSAAMREETHRQYRKPLQDFMEMYLSGCAIEECITISQPKGFRNTDTLHPSKWYDLCVAFLAAYPERVRRADRENVRRHLDKWAGISASETIDAGELPDAEAQHDDPGTRRLSG